MALDEQAIKYRSLDDWFKTPQGNGVAIAFASELASVSPQFNGDTLLQFGNCGDNLWFSSLRFRHKWVVTPYVDTQKSSFIASLNGLPIERNSIDCIIAPLTMEAFIRDKNPLNEIDRILKPMGYVVFFGINPVSFWGIALRWGNLACFGNAAPTLTSSLSIKHAMLSRGYQQCFHSSFYYIPPVKNKNLIEKLAFFNMMGKMIWPFPAGLYCIILQKFDKAHPSLVVETPHKNFILQPSITA